MKIAVTGASGLIGRALSVKAADEGDTVCPLVRRPAAPQSAEIPWDPALGVLCAADLEGMAAVVHLAGESIASGRWTEARRARLRDSRLNGTALLCRALEQLRQPPRVLVAASAAGYYGDRGEMEVDEDAAPGNGFLSGLVQEWEAATMPAQAAGIRVVNARFGMVLSRAGGALARQLPLFRWGLGGPLGGGRQYMSWISMTDAIQALWHVLHEDAVRGPCNVVSPCPVTNAEYSQILGRVLRRPVWLPVPARVLRLALGALADEVLLVSARVRPQRLVDSGFRFTCPRLEPALRKELGR